MSGPVTSPLWYRLAELRPRLRAHVRVQRHKYRDQTWYQVTDAGSGRRHRMNEAAYRFVGRLDGRHTAGEVWDALAVSYGDAALTQDQAIRVLGQLNAAGLVQCELTPDIAKLFQQHRRQARRRRWTELNPLAIRVRLFDPSRHLVAFDSWLPGLFSPAAFGAWLAVVVLALLFAAGHWQELQAYAVAHVDTPRALLIAWLAYPLIKALHELGHALAVRRWGGAVHDVGFTLFVVVPVPYVDASAASGFTRVSQRAIVSGIGIMVELFVAALALFVWLNVQPGWVRDTAFVVMLIAAVSTVVFNGNPLLRFDGYHLFCDLLELPNLDARSRSWWVNLVHRRIFRLETAELPVAAGERKWLLAYAPLALAFRLHVGMLIAIWVGGHSALLGIAIACMVVILLFILPVTRLVMRIMHSARGTQRSRALRIAAGAALAMTAACAVPVPYGAVAQAVVWLPEHSHVRAGTDGFVSEMRVRDGANVTPGQVLAILEDPALIVRHAEVSSRLAALRVRYFHTLQSDRLQAQNISRAIGHAEADLARLTERVAHLEIRAAVAGRMVMARQDDLPGVYLRKGQLLGYVLAPGQVLVRAVVPHEDAALVGERSRSAAVWLEEARGRSMSGELRREVSAATFRLPSAALADRYGGTVLTDPADTEHLRTLQPLFTIDVALPHAEIQRIGGRAWVRFDYGPEPLAFQWARALAQLFLRRFDTVAGA